jgi:type II secretory pathway pseudopilin PulG
MGVVAVLALVAVAGLAQVARSRVSALEQVALKNLRTVVKACQLYYLANQSYPSALHILHASTPQYLDDDFTIPRQGYRFTYVAIGDRATFTLAADPAEASSAARRHYFTDQSATVRSRHAQAAGPDDPVLP